jgi:hypothetical protein
LYGGSAHLEGRVHTTFSSLLFISTANPEAIMKLTITAPLRGNHFRPASAKAIYNSLEFDEAIDLIPEPENPYDSNAVMAHARGEHIAYVGKEFAAEIFDKEIISCKYEGSDMVEIVYIIPDANTDTERETEHESSE